MKATILSVVCTVVLVCFSCSEKNTECMAGHAAKEYYDMLFAGDYAGFTSGLFFPDSIPGTYREQLISNAAMFAEGQKKAHNGVREIRVLGFNVDSVSSTTQAFLLFCYGDSVNEEIVVPMTEHDGRWFMR